MVRCLNAGGKLPTVPLMMCWGAHTSCVSVQGKHPSKGAVNMVSEDMVAKDVGIGWAVRESPVCYLGKNGLVLLLHLKGPSKQCCETAHLKMESSKNAAPEFEHNHNREKDVYSLSVPRGRCHKSCQWANNVQIHLEHSVNWQHNIVLRKLWRNNWGCHTLKQ